MFSGESTFRKGPGGLLFAQIENDLAKATLCLQGAQLTHWEPRSQAEPVTFMSATVQYSEGKSIRGGVPICWPWFGPHATDKARASHGFARNVLWEARAPVCLENGATQLSLFLSDSEKSRALWPYRFGLEYRVTVGEVLDLELTSTNTGSEAFPLSEALHTYFQVGDIGSVQVLGLDGSEFVDVADGGQRKRQDGPVTFAAEVDRVYVNTEATCTIVDPRLKRRIHISKRGGHSTVVWNPWEKKAAGLADLGVAPATRGGWRQFVCVESANARDNTLTLAAGQSHCLAVQYEAEPI
ncbi:MAG: D-hexose-6-phosphate mutarotase [Steroidobacteraceae bacterium]